MVTALPRRRVRTRALFISLLTRNNDQKRPSNHSMKTAKALSNRYNCVRSCFCYRQILVLLMSLLFALHGFAADGKSDPNDPNTPEDTYYDEISVTLNVLRIGSTELSAIIKGQNAYLPVKEMFDFLKIRNHLSPEMDTISGFFIFPEAPFIIDKTSVTYQGKKTLLKTNDLFINGSDFYLKSDYFTLFGLECNFSFRSLSVNLVAKVELPVIREMQQEQMRRNISTLKGEKKADTTFGRTFPFFQVGMADWALSTTSQKGVVNNSIAGINLGMMIGGGEANANLNFVSGQPFNPRNQLLRWRFVNNESAVIKQVTAGRVFAQQTATITGPLNGLQISNTPTTYRKSFGTYTLSNTIQPGWTVELYVNNILVNYSKADASGFYTFDVPIVYGNSVIKLRFYGPWGEEQTKEEFVSIPFNFLPVNQFEYTFTGGMVSDEERSRYSKAKFAYGLTKRITVGGGMEYLSSVKSGANMPFVNTSIRMGAGTLFSLDRSFGVRTKAVLNYRHHSNFQAELTYTGYDKEQTAIRFTYLDQKKLMLSMPVSLKSFSAFTRFTFNQYSLPKSKYTTAEWLISGSLKGVSTNITSALTHSSFTKSEAYTSLSLNFRLPKGIRLNPQVQYNYSQQNVTSIRCEAEKKVLDKAYVNLVWDKDLRFKSEGLTLSMRYNFSFVQATTSARTSNRGAAFSQTARGSLLYNDQTHKLSTSDQAQVGRAAVIIVPFLDLNCNDIWDSSEPKAFGLNLSVTGGRMQRNIKDTTIQITGMEAYNNYFVELDKMSFENVAWQIKKPVLKIIAEPNYFKQVQIPVSVLGEVSGSVVTDASGGIEKGIARIIVNLHNEAGQVVAKILSEQDGYFSYIGLAPGLYTARVDKEQMHKLKMKGRNSDVFQIKVKYDGDVVEGMQIKLENL